MGHEVITVNDSDSSVKQLVFMCIHLHTQASRASTGLSCTHTFVIVDEFWYLYRYNFLLHWWEIESFQRTSHLGCSAIELSTRGQHYDPLHTFPLAAYSSEVYQISPSGKLTHGPHKVSHSCVMVFSTKVGALCLCFTPRCRGVSPQGVQAEPRFHAIWLPHLSSKHTENSIKVSPHGMSNEGTLLLTSLILIFNFQLYRC